MSKIFIFINGTNYFGVESLALAEEGEILTSHISSNESWAKHDMGLTSDWKHNVYDEHYPEGWELEYISDVEKALEENEKFKKAMQKAKGEE